MRRRCIAAIGAALLSSCGNLGGGGWQVTSETDAMTDASSTKAVAKLTGELFDVETTIVCSSNGHLTYTFTTFDKEGNVAEIKPAQVMGFWVMPVGVRRDDGKATPYWQSEPRYTNQITISSPEGRKDLAGGSKLTLRFPFLSGIETLIIDQTDGALRSVLDPCVDMQQAAIDERAAMEQQEAEVETADESEETSYESEGASYEPEAAEEVSPTGDEGEITNYYADHGVEPPSDQGDAEGTNGF